MFIPVVIDYALLKDVAVVALSARGECRAEVCRLVDVVVLRGGGSEYRPHGGLI